MERWTRCVTHAAVFPAGSEEDHKAGPLGEQNAPGKCEFVSSLILVPDDDGSFHEADKDVVWVRDSYTAPRESLFDCEVCRQPIEDWDFWTCLDGGEAAHMACVHIRRG